MAHRTEIGVPDRNMTAVAADDTPLWLFADQLSPRIIDSADHAGRPIILVEADSALRRRRFHRQKLHLVLSALRHARA